MSTQIENLTSKTIFISTGNLKEEFPRTKSKVAPDQAIDVTLSGPGRITIQEATLESQMTGGGKTIKIMEATITELVRQIESLKLRMDRTQVELHDTTKAIANHVKVGDFCPHKGE